MCIYKYHLKLSISTWDDDDCDFKETNTNKAHAKCNKNSKIFFFSPRDLIH